ncbi:MAG: hypothetical protein RLZZ337_1770 [Bacteroidota bacterium]|jgi:dsDNA-specific endonuclease/ATPase MutS2
MEDNPIDPELLKRMMLGDFSSAFSDKKDKKNTKQPKKKWEIDLHFEKLYPEKSNSTPSEKLELQLKSCSDFLQDARKQGVRIVYIVVGKGEGVLKNEVQKQLKKEKIAHSVVYDPPYFGNAIKVNV